MLTADLCYRAIAARDRRFDGQFFTGVLSTGIFCRPICPAPTPKRAHCTFFASAAAALEAGFRPCLRCRPEVSPDMPAWLGTSQTVQRALRLVNEGALDEAPVSALAERLGVGERHLRRLFRLQLGASPVAVAQARRLLFAKRLTMETSIPLTQVAMAAGYGSLRRFHASFQKTYGRAPGALRRSAGEADSGGGPLVVRLPYTEPFDWDGLLSFLRPRAIPGVERAGPDSYCRVFRAGDKDAGRVTVMRPDDAGGFVEARLEIPSVAYLRPAIEAVNRVFDLRAAPDVIAAQLGSVAVAGVRVPGAWDPFELSVRAVLGQQVTVAGATTLAGRIVERCGEAAADFAEPPNRLFPTAATLAVADLSGLGLTNARIACIRALSQAVAEGELNFDRLHTLDDAVAALCRIPGIGEWTAQYIAMRALGEPDAFPSGDLGLRKALSPDGQTPVTSQQLEQAAEAWRPWRAYAAMSLWRR